MLFPFDALHDLPCHELSFALLRNFIIQCNFILRDIALCEIKISDKILYCAVARTKIFLRGKEDKAP